MAVDPLTLDFGRSKRFCVYVYFDPRPRKKRVPIWVGKGLTKSRPDQHWKYGSHNRLLNRIFAKLRAQGLEPIVEYIAFFDDETLAFACEIELIKKFGRRDQMSGTLCNLTAGGEGPPAGPAAASSAAAGNRARTNAKLTVAEPLWLDILHYTVAEIAKECGLDRATLYRRLGPRWIDQDENALRIPGKRA